MKTGGATPCLEPHDQRECPRHPDKEIGLVASYRDKVEQGRDAAVIRSHLHVPADRDRVAGGGRIHQSDLLDQRGQSRRVRVPESRDQATASGHEPARTG